MDTHQRRGGLKVAHHQRYGGLFLGTGLTVASVAIHLAGTGGSPGALRFKAVDAKRSPTRGKISFGNLLYGKITHTLDYSRAAHIGP